jgi:CRP-like cAMP-binding protein
MVDSEIVAGLRTCELFAALSEQEVEGLIISLAGSCQVADYQAGDTIFVQGELSKVLYVVVDGQVLIRRTFPLGDRMGTKMIALLGKGRAMGWSALLYEHHYATASAVCQKPARVILVDGATLRSALQKDKSVGFRVMERLASMLGDRLLAAYSAMETHL